MDDTLVIVAELAIPKTSRVEERNSVIRDLQTVLLRQCFGNAKATKLISHQAVTEGKPEIVRSLVDVDGNTGLSSG